MRKPDPFSDIGLLSFRMAKSQQFSIRPGTLVTVDEKAGLLRIASPDEPVRSFRVPANARVEGACICWRQDEPLQHVECEMPAPSHMTKGQLAQRIEKHLPALDTAITTSQELERRERIEALDESGLAVVKGPHLDHRGILRRLQDDLRELLRRLHWDAQRRDG
jgi:asparagine synthetase B (glutamine-hydrolysing)